MCRPHWYWNQNPQHRPPTPSSPLSPWGPWAPESLVNFWSVAGLVVTGVAGSSEMGVVRVCRPDSTPELGDPWRSSCLTPVTLIIQKMV